MTKYKPGTRVQKNNTMRMFIVVGAVIAASIGAGIYTTTGMFKPSADNQPMVMHIHPGLSLIIDGKPVTIPANIGIDASLYKNHTLDQYGMKMPDMPSMPVMYPTHTHDTSGTIHVESNVKRDYTIGDFLSVWGMDFSGKTVNMTVNGQPATDSNYRAHVFKDGEQIMLDVKSG